MIKRKSMFQLVFLSALTIVIGCSRSNKQMIVNQIGNEEYNRLMGMSPEEFDQSNEGFRQHSENYELTRIIIPEFIKVNELSEAQSRNLHWHLGQIHAFNENYEDAIFEMKQSYVGGSKTWECYVNGTIAFLEKDKTALDGALKTLSQQENQMNIEILEKFIKYFDLPYAEAYSADF